MQATLMNFGDNTRVVCDVNNKQIVIGIGKIVETDIHDAHFHMIKRAVKTDTLMVVPKTAVMSDRLLQITGLLESLDGENYDDALRHFNELLPNDGTAKFRPTRDMIRVALRETARDEVGRALGMASRVMIHEEGDQTTRKDPEPEPKTIVVPPEETQQPKVVEPPRTKRAGK